ncbi:MAG: ABC transporter ATP-binding protein [Pseudomonadota bacterium]
MKALSIRNLKKTYSNGHVALRGIDLDVDEGDFFALLGPNGAGKSTTIGIVSSLVNKSAGSVEVFGHDLDRNRDAAKSCIGLVPQEINFNQFETPLSIVMIQAGYYGIPRKEAYKKAEFGLRQLRLWDKRNTVSRRLSGGMKRRLMIARALVHSPRLLILDEPTAGVDIEIRRAMWDFLREINRKGTTIILTTHYLEEAESLCRNIAIINHGAIAEHSDMASLLSKLKTDYFLLDLKHPLDVAPVVAGYRLELVDPCTLDVAIPKEHGINNLFLGLARQNIEVMSMRNKANRLEQMFMDLVTAGQLAV